MKRVAVSGSNFKFPDMMLNPICKIEITMSQNKTKISGAKNLRSSFLRPIKAKIDARTPKHENPK